MLLIFPIELSDTFLFLASDARLPPRVVIGLVSVSDRFTTEVQSQNPSDFTIKGMPGQVGVI